jgi:hypothetical protein
VARLGLRNWGFGSSDVEGIPCGACLAWHPWQEDGTAPYPHIVLDRSRFGYFPALDPGFHLKGMGGGVDLDDRPHRDRVANLHHTVVKNRAPEIQIDMVADMSVLTVATVEGWLNDRILTDSS